MDPDRASRRTNRVVHVTTVHEPFDPRIFYKQLWSLREAGFDVHFVAPRDEAGQERGIAVHALPEPRSRTHRLALQPHVFRLARELDADLYQVHDPELLPLAGLLRWTTGARIVYDMHENYRTKGPVWGPLLRALERWSFRWLDHVLLAESSYRPIVAGHAVPSTHIANYFRPLGDTSPLDAADETVTTPPTRLLYTGTISEGRGLRTMVELAAQIRQAGRPEVLELVGVCRREDQRTWAEDQIRANALGDVIHCKGWDTYVPASDLLSHCRTADVGLALFNAQPNYVESVPTKFYEYLHYGLPIICSDFPLWRRFVEENACGAVVPPGDPAAVLDVLDEWRTNPDQYRPRARNARAAASKYRWAPMGERLVDVYRSLLDPESGEPT